MNEDLTKEPGKIRVDEDGIELKWDEDRKAWFPNIDEEFIYKHNLNYGFTTEEVADQESEPAEAQPAVNYPEWYMELWKDFLEISKSENIDLSKLPLEEYNTKWELFYSKNAEKYEKKKNKTKKRTAKANAPAWFEVEENQNRHIYVDNLPLDITLEEFIELVSKYGLLMHEPFTNIPKVKLYEDRDGNVKGDGICCYLKVESVDLALNLLDGYNLRGNTIKVSRAKFELKGDFDPKRRRRITNKEKKKLQKNQESLFRWGPDTKAIRPKKDNTIVLKNVFDSQSMKENPELAFDVKEKISKDAKNIGTFKSIQVHDLHPEAVVQINFTDANLSDIAVEYFNNKIWNGRKITAEIWDGRTKYKVKETVEEEKERIKKWENSLEGKITKDGEKEGVETDEEIKSDNEEDEVEQESLENFVKALENDEALDENADEFEKDHSEKNEDSDNEEDLDDSESRTFDLNKS